MTYFEFMIAGGTILTIIGIVGILWAMRQVMIAKSRNKGNNAALNEAVKAVVPINIGALVLSFLGLMFVIIGIMLS